ncbi:hypothetical protein KA005_54300 [bacterium]|nr:hypothetical protein [bacterium]
MAKRIMRVFIELDYPEDMPDPLDPNNDPIRLFQVINRILDAGSIANGYTLEKFARTHDVGFKLVKT